MVKDVSFSGANIGGLNGLSKEKISHFFLIFLSSHKKKSFRKGRFPGKIPMKWAFFEIIRPISRK